MELNQKLKLKIVALKIIIESNCEVPVDCDAHLKLVDSHLELGT